MSLSRQEFFAAKPVLARKEVAVPHFGPDAKVTVFEMTGLERDEFEKVHSEQRFTDGRARFVVAGVRDADGNPLFTKDDIGFINSLPSTALDPIVEAVMELNGLNKEAAKDAEKN